MKLCFPRGEDLTFGATQPWFLFDLNRQSYLYSSVQKKFHASSIRLRLRIEHSGRFIVWSHMGSAEAHS